MHIFSCRGGISAPKRGPEMQIQDKYVASIFSFLFMSKFDRCILLRNMVFSGLNRCRNFIEIQATLTNTCLLIKSYFLLLLLFYFVEIDATLTDTCLSISLFFQCLYLQSNIIKSCFLFLLEDLWF